MGHMHKHQNGWSSFKKRAEMLSDNDFEEGSGETDFSSVGDVSGNWYEFDLSSIVPKDCIGIYFKCSVKDGVAGSRIAFRDPEYPDAYKVSTVRTQVANLYNDGFGFCPVHNQKIEFMCNPKASDFTNIAISILGWDLS